MQYSSLYLSQSIEKLNFPKLALNLLICDLRWIQISIFTLINLIWRNQGFFD